MANSLPSPATVLYRSQIGKCEKLLNTRSCILRGFLVCLDKCTHLKHQLLGTRMCVCGGGGDRGEMQSSLKRSLATKRNRCKLKMNTLHSGNQIMQIHPLSTSYCFSALADFLRLGRKAQGVIVICWVSC